MTTESKPLFDPTPEVVSQVNSLLSDRLPSRTNQRLADLTIIFGNHYGELAQYHSQRVALLTPIEDRLADISNQRTKLIDDRRNAVYQSEHDQSNPEIMLERIVRKINRLPRDRQLWWMQLVKAIFRPQNSLTDPLEQELANLEKEAKEQSQARLAANQQIDTTINPAIGEITQVLVQTSDQMTRIWEPATIQDIDLAGDYVRLRPSRLNPVASAYARQFNIDDPKADPTWGNYYDQFLTEQKPYPVMSSREIRRAWVDYIRTAAVREWIKQ